MILERLLEKRAKKVKVDIGDGEHYEYDDTDPHGAEDAKWMQHFRKPKGVLGAAFSNPIPWLSIVPAQMLAQHYVFKDSEPADKAIGSLLTGLLTGIGGGAINVALNYGKRMPVEEARKSLEAIRNSRKSSPTIYNINKKLFLD